MTGVGGREGQEAREAGRAVAAGCPWTPVRTIKDIQAERIKDLWYRRRVRRYRVRDSRAEASDEHHLEVSLSAESVCSIIWPSPRPCQPCGPLKAILSPAQINRIDEGAYDFTLRGEKKKIIVFA